MYTSADAKNNTTKVDFNDMNNRRAISCTLSLLWCKFNFKCRETKCNSTVIVNLDLHCKS